MQTFNPAPGSPRVDTERNLPAIAELLRLDWSRRSQVAKRVRRALAVMVANDPRYKACLVKGRLPGMWRLEASRTQLLAGGVPTSPLPPPVMAAWRLAYGTRSPSKKQTAVLTQLTARRGSAWVTSRLRAEYPDPFGALLELDQAQRHSDNEALVTRERARDQERQAEAIGFQSLGQLLNKLRLPEG